MVSTTNPVPPVPQTPPPNDPAIGITSNLIAYFEQFLATAQWDVNAYRFGFGSDTNGAAQTPVHKGDHTTRPEALANLAARVPKYLATVRDQVGSDLYDKLGLSTRAALGSMAYNYGRVPANVVLAVKTDGSKVAAAIRACGKDNHGINQWRRDGEAAVIALDGGQY